MANIHCVSFGLVVSVAILLSACGKEQENQESTQPGNALSESSSDMLLSPNGNLHASSENAPVAIKGASEIPYPVYPNGSKYRVGGEHGLKIVVFETQDTFEEVDKFYKTVSAPTSMPRLVAMNDYVRYGSDADDVDPWATYRPGIVIHQFNDDAERSAVGARADSRTNIIMSY